MSCLVSAVQKNATMAASRKVRFARDWRKRLAEIIDLASSRV